MKAWLIKFRISRSLDDRTPLPPAVERAISRSEAARLFAENSKALDQALKLQLPEADASASLHSSIMRAVQSGARARAMQNQSLWPRWIPVTSLTLLILLGVLLAIQFSPTPGGPLRPAEPPSLAAVSSVLESGGSMVRAAPAAALSPLSDEMERLDRDLVNTKHFLLASLP